MQFSVNFKGNPLLWINFGLRAPLMSKICWARRWSMPHFDLIPSLPCYLFIIHCSRWSWFCVVLTVFRAAMPELTEDTHFNTSKKMLQTQRETQWFEIHLNKRKKIIACYMNGRNRELLNLERKRFIACVYIVWGNWWRWVLTSCTCWVLLCVSVN